jgi:Tol biopolymer transport system component
MNMLFQLVVSFVLLLSFSAPPQTCWQAETLTSTPNDDLDPRWSPDGAQIAFVGHHEGNPEVYLLDVATKLLKNLSNAPEDDYAPLWSPDGRYIAYFHRLQKYASNPVMIRVVEVATGIVRHVMDEPMHVQYQSLHWTSDNNQLFFTADNRVLVYALASGKLHELYGKDPFQASLYAIYSPDSQWMAVSLADYSQSNYLHYYVEVINLATGEVLPLDVSDLHNWSPAWSKDSRYLAFRTNGSPQYVNDLYVLELQTGELWLVERVKQAGLDLWGWSLDNQLVWEVSEQHDNFTHVLHVTDVATRQSREVLRINPALDHVVWSPTQNHIALQTYAGIYVADAASGVFSELVQGLGKVDRIIWSPDGTMIASRIRYTPFDTGQAVVVTDIQGSKYVYADVSIQSEPQWSPDSLHLLFSVWRDGDNNLVLLSSCDSFQP